MVTIYGACKENYWLQMLEVVVALSLFTSLNSVQHAICNKTQKHMHWLRKFMWSLR